MIATSQAMRAALTRQGNKVTFHVFPGLDHYGNNLGQGVRGNVWVETARDWMRN